MKLIGFVLVIGAGIAFPPLGFVLLALLGIAILTDRL